MWNKDEVKGKAEKIKGEVKEQIGKATKNPNLEQEGRDDQVKGTIQDKFGEARRKAGEVVEKVGKNIKRG